MLYNGEMDKTAHQIMGNLTVYGVQRHGGKIKN